MLPGMSYVEKQTLLRSYSYDIGLDVPFELVSCHKNEVDSENKHSDLVQSYLDLNIKEFFGITIVEFMKLSQLDTLELLNLASEQLAKLSEEREETT